MYIFIYIHCWEGGGSAIDNQKNGGQELGKVAVRSTTTGDAPPRKEWGPARSSKIIANYVPIFWSCVMAMLWYDMAMILSIKIV